MEKITKTSALIQKLRIPSLQVRWITVKTRFKLEDDLQKRIDEELVKPRAHPGVIKKKLINIPEWIVEAMNENLDDYKDEVLKQHKKFSNYLFSRRLPLEEHQLKQKYLDIEADMLGDQVNQLSEDELYETRKKIKGKAYKKLKEKVFSWKALDYDDFRSSLYMVTRGAPEYAVLSRIFSEIQVRDPEFKPTTIFDFGSGVGSVLWAANETWKSITEYTGIDISEKISDLAQKVNKSSPTQVKGVYYRQYLPVSNLKSDIVVSAFSLMELPNAKNRLEVLAKLWRKTNKYLVIVEQGSYAGFTLVNEARDFIRHVMEKIDKSDYFTFAPCPHDLPCPKRKGADRIPCNFLVQYRPLRLLGSNETKNELFSYVVLKKSVRKEEDSWHRCVGPTLLRSKHVRCRFCTPDGNLEEVVFSPGRDGRLLYRCAKATRWGARLAIKPKSPDEMSNGVCDQNSPSTETNDEESDDELGQTEEVEVSTLKDPGATFNNEK
ncbi:hypothetical protein QAD02_010187 [Eretmocerus hayati]|uniref:Uncharacterized protein n=1 Tax=Eretmocerus hayati TaxID=131215 RepID=A0ACC2NDW1_9HYME|nr:hypothetical protein QAD02_010187 [Eretmocerus hayati]